MYSLKLITSGPDIGKYEINEVKTDHAALPLVTPFPVVTYNALHTPVGLDAYWYLETSNSWSFGNVDWRIHVGCPTGPGPPGRPMGNFLVAANNGPSGPAGWASIVSQPAIPLNDGGYTVVSLDAPSCSPLFQYVLCSPHPLDPELQYGARNIYLLEISEPTP